MSETTYSDEWAEDEQDDSPKLSKEEKAKLSALNTLAVTAQAFVDESVQMRNGTTLPEELKRAYRLYNASSVDALGDLMSDFEGTRTSMTEGSSVIMNIVRQITNDGASQLGDMLFPTDEDNYGINGIAPPKPPLRLRMEPELDASGQPVVNQESGEPVTQMQAWEARKAALAVKVERMASLMDGTLDRIQFGKIGRCLIDSGARTGTGILKGPYVDPQGDKKWKSTGGKWSLAADAGRKATFCEVSVLDFFPDMSAEVVDDCAYVNVRNWALPRQILQLSGGGYYPDQVARLVLKAPKEISSPESDHERAYIKDKAVDGEMYAKRYELWETWADFDVEELLEAGVKVPSSLSGQKTVLACVIHCAGITLKAYVAPQQHKLPFHVWCWDDDPTSIFGKGVPILTENSQLTYNAVWRMILDHGGVSAVPQIVMMRNKLTPANGDKNDFSIRGGKVWEYQGDTFNLPDGSNARPFEVYDLPAHLDQFFAILEKAEEDAYKTSGVTRVEKNQAGVDNAPATLGATQIYQNNASVSRRRQVRDFDDDITKSALTGLYDWFMKYEKDDDVKGAMSIEPRGSSVLMQREVNTQNLLMFLQATGNGAIPGAKTEAILRRIESGMQFPSGTMVETEEETLQRQQLEAENPPIDPAVQMEQMKLELEQGKAELKGQEIEAKMELEQARLQLDGQIANANIQLKSISDERTHVREMLRMELMDKAEGSRQFASLQSKDAELSVKVQDIQTKRDIEAGKLLEKQQLTSAQAESQVISAVARERDSRTKESELANKLAGTITQGI